VAALLIATGPASAITRAARDRRAMDAAYNTWKSNIVGLCMGVIDHKAHVIKCYGSLAPGSSAKPNASTLFGIASITKTVTATELATAVARHTVRLNGQLRRFFPRADGRAEVPRNVTLRDLAQHYSGLPRDPANNTVFTFNDLFKEAADCYASTAMPPCLAAPPETKSLYSNWGFAILGIALGRRDEFAPQPLPSGNVLPPWEPDVREHVLDPLGLRHTASFVGFDQRHELPYFRAHVAGAFLSDDTTPWSPPFLNGAPVVDPAGGLYSDSNDMMTWLRYAMTGNGPGPLHTGYPLLFNRPAVNRRGGLGQIGLGWNITTANGYTEINKDGRLPGYLSFISFVKGHKLGSFVLLNAGARPGFDSPDVSCSLMRRLSPAGAKLPCPAADDPTYPANTVVVNPPVGFPPPP
jgi:D-alanyl-D-alanine carboxypeptidase